MGLPKWATTLSIKPKWLLSGLRKNTVNVLALLPQSPDLIPIENLWADAPHSRMYNLIYTRSVRKNGTEFKKIIVKNVWKEIQNIDPTHTVPTQCYEILRKRSKTVILDTLLN